MYGNLINKEYLVFKMIGRGVYSKVWLAFKISNETFVALKMVDDEDRTEAMRELGINLQLLKSKNLGILVDHFRYNDNTCMIFPLYGGTIYELFKDRTCPPSVLNNIFETLKAKLQELHNTFNLIHGDVKPENVAVEFANPNVQEFIERFNNYLEKYDGSFSKFSEVTCNGDLEKSCTLLFDDIFYPEDANSENFGIYNSSDEDSEGEDSGNEADIESSDVDSIESDSDEDDRDGEEEDEEEDEEDDEDEKDVDDETDSIESESDYESVTSSVTNASSYNFWSQLPLENLKLHLIDYSHTHVHVEDLDYKPTRYYRCLQTLQNEKSGYYKDWYALACTMYELETGNIFANPTSDNKDEEQIEIIKKNIHKIDKWLVKS